MATRRDPAIMYILEDTGCRVGGLRGLKVKDVDLERNVASCHLLGVLGVLVGMAVASSVDGIWGAAWTIP